MADASDVANTLVNLVAGIVYPDGTGSPSIVGTTVGIERGWPIPDELQAQLAQNQCIVSIYAPPGMERNTTRYPRQEFVTVPPVHTLNATTNGNTITIGGAVATPQNVLAVAGNQFAWSYAVQANDTLSTIAQGLAALIAVQFPGTTSNGAVITVVGKPGILQARIAARATVWTEQSRQEKVFWIVCWCPQPVIRDALASAIDVGLKQLDFIPLSDNSVGRLRYDASRESDEGEKNEIYRRDLLFSVEYATATTTTAPETGTVGVTTSPAPQITTYV